MLKVHTWLHVVDIMEWTGPLWGYWCWVMERYCSRLVRSVSSQRFPDGSLNHCIFKLATLTSVVNMHDLTTALPSRAQVQDQSQSPNDTFTVDYPEIQLSRPCHTLNLASTPDLTALHSHITVDLAMQWGLVSSEIKPSIPTQVRQFGRLHICDGDTIHAGLAPGANAAGNGHRDATFFQYELRIDQYTHQGNVAPVMDSRMYYGQLKCIVVLTIPVTPGLPLTRLTNFILLDVNREGRSLQSP